MNKDSYTLNDLLIMKMQALYDIEHEIVEALPKMIKAATDEDLKEGFSTHLIETEAQIERLKEVFEILNEKPEKLKVEGIRGILKDGVWVIKNIKNSKALDANLIAAASYVEHYEMAGYIAAISWANILGYSDVADLLEENLSEEKATDEKLSHLASSKIDLEARQLTTEE